MAHQQEESPQYPARPTVHRAVLVVTLLFVLAAVSVSAGLVVYTALLHNLKNGLFALAFAVLSTRAALSWLLWQAADQQTPANDQQKIA